jgi:hypothetical protein
MVTLMELPTEILRLILGALANMDLLSLFASRRTCRAIQTISTDILDNTIANHGVAVHNLVMSQFSSVLDSRSAGPPYQPSFELPCAPYAALPWVSNPERREKYLRMEASWRQIPLASPSGQLVHTMQVVRQSQNHFPGPVIYLTGGVVGSRMMVDEGEEHYDFPKGLKLGLVYDMMIQNVGTDQQDWELLFETGVRDPLEFGDFMRSVRSDDREAATLEEVRSHFEHKDHCALMLISTSEWCSHYEGPKRDLWEPEVLGEDCETCRDFPMPR